MNTDKYLELLRFYMTEKINEINKSLKKSLEDEVQEIVSSIVSAIFAVFVSSEAIKLDGIVGVSLKVILVVASWFAIKFLFRKMQRSCRTKKELDNIDSNKLTEAEAKSLVDKFDHITCDGILLAWDFLDKNKSIDPSRVSAKEFYLIEAFYYYNKALQIGVQIVAFSEFCMNNESTVNRIARYRLLNVYQAFVEISTEIEKRIAEGGWSTEFIKEVTDASKGLKKIAKYLDAQCESR